MTFMNSATTAQTFPPDVLRAAEAAVAAWMKPDRYYEQSMAEMVALVVVQDRAARTRPVSAGLTARQRQLLDFITAYQAQHRYPPSFVEMADMLGLASKSGVHRIINGLVERGAVKRIPYRARSIHIAGRV
jgi:hypothetical protein